MGEEFQPNPYIVARLFERLQRGRLKRTELQMATGLKWSDFSRYLTRFHNEEYRQCLRSRRVEACS